MNGIRSITTAQWGLTIAKRSGQRLTYPYTSYQVPNSIPIGAVQLSSYPNYSIGMAIMPNSATVSSPTPTSPANLSIRDFQTNTTLGVLSVWGGTSAISTIPVAARPPVQLIQVAAGYRHLLALKPDGVVVAWGDNSYGQLNVPSVLTVSRINTDPLRVVAIAAGAFYSMALRANGSVFAWGDNVAGQTNIPINFSDNILNPAATATSTLTITATNTATSTSTATNTSTSTPTKTSTATNTNTTTATKTNTATNTNTTTATKTYTATTTATPSATAILAPYVVQIAAGMRHSVALLNNGTVQSWGDNTYGQQNTPYIAGVVKIAAAGWHTVALLRNKTVVAWGRNNYGQTDVSTLTNVVDIATTQDNSIFLLGNGQVVVIGSNSYDQQYVPDGSYQRIGGGVFHMLAIQANGSISGWGMNTNSQLAIPSNLVFPFQVVGGFNFSAALSQSIGSSESVGATATATIPSIPQIPTAFPAISRTNLITLVNATASSITPFTGNGLTFAQNMTGTLALDGTLSFSKQPAPLLPALNCGDSKLIPTSLASMNDNYQLLLSTSYGMTLTRSRTVRVWGCNGSTMSDLTAAIIPSAFQNNVAEIALRGTHIMILTVDGRVWSNQFTIPLQINIRHIAAGANFASVLLNDGTVQVWALNNLDGIMDIPTPATTLTDIAAGDYHIVALRSDGRSISWGANAHDLGQADTPFAANSNVISIAAGENQSMALLSNGDAVAWGKYAAGTSNALYNINSEPTYFISGMSTGDNRIALYITTVTPGYATPTVISTATPVIVPTMTPRALDKRDQIAWFTMADTTLTATNFGCETLYTCPGTVFDGTNVLKFNDNRGDELVSNNALNLNNTAFSIRARVRRDAVDRADVIMSLGTPGTVRGYLSFGFDRENRPYCGFGQEDLRSTT
jgi:alpha-tubulin suppressor-like RCC1 family protein